MVLSCESESESYTSILQYQVLVISDCCISNLSQQTSPSCVASSGLIRSINTPSTKLSHMHGASRRWLRHIPNSREDTHRILRNTSQDLLGGSPSLDSTPCLVDNRETVTNMTKAQVSTSWVEITFSRGCQSSAQKTSHGRHPSTRPTPALPPHHCSVFLTQPLTTPFDYVQRFHVEKRTTRRWATIYILCATVRDALSLNGTVNVTVCGVCYIDIYQMWCFGGQSGRIGVGPCMLT